jgi:hypothetical protein
MGKKFKGEGVEHKPLRAEGKEPVGSDGTMVNVRPEGWKEIQIGAYYKTAAEGETADVRCGNDRKARRNRETTV